MAVSSFMELADSFDDDDDSDFDDLDGDIDIALEEHETDHKPKHSATSNVKAASAADIPPPPKSQPKMASKQGETKKTQEISSNPVPAALQAKPQAPSATAALVPKKSDVNLAFVESDASENDHEAEPLGTAEDNADQPTLASEARFAEMLESSSVPPTNNDPFSAVHAPAVTDPLLSNGVTVLKAAPKKSQPKAFADTGTTAMTNGGADVDAHTPAPCNGKEAGCGKHKKAGPIELDPSKLTVIPKLSGAVIIDDGAGGHSASSSSGSSSHSLPKLVTFTSQSNPKKAYYEKETSLHATNVDEHGNTYLKSN